MPSVVGSGELWWSNFRFLRGAKQTHTHRVWLDDDSTTLVPFRLVCTALFGENR